MTTFETYLLQTDETWSLVPYEEFDGVFSDPNLIDGALAINGDAEIKIETENIDVLWASIIGAIRDLLHGQRETKALMPDFPGQLQFRSISGGKLELTYDDDTFHVDQREFVRSLANAAWPFCKKMCTLLPGNSASYEAQELTQLGEIFDWLGTQPPS